MRGWRCIVTTVALAGVAGALAGPRPVQAQGAPDIYGSGAKLELNDDGSNFIRFVTWHQVWLRAIQNNPGTIVDGSDDEWTGDIMLRRSRFLIFGEIDNRVLILTHFGINNQTFTNGGVFGDGFRPQIYFHGAWAEFRAIEDYLFLGGGLIYWTGVSRMTTASTLNFLALDAPILNWPTIERTDQFARQLGIYAKGEIATMHYQVALTRPFVRDIAAFVRPEDAVPQANYNAVANSFALHGYFAYQFLDQESHKVPYTVGSYLGTKRVLNVGAGFHWHPNGTVSCDSDGAGGCPEDDQSLNDIFLFGADVFADLPMGDGALTAYLAYYYYDFGPDALRRIGIGNLASGNEAADPDAPNGAFGNAYPNIGTGNHVFTGLGYMLPVRPFGQHKIVPYTTFQVSSLEALEDPSIIFGLGAKYHLIGHHASVTLHWRNRPTFIQDDAGVVALSDRVENRANELIMQLMIYL